MPDLWRRLQRDWQALRAMTWRQVRQLVAAAVLLPLSALWLRLVGYRRLAAWLQGHHPVPEAQAPDGQGQLLAQAQRTAQAVAVASSRGLFRPNCLEQSLVLWWLLRRQGVASDLQFGVRKEGEQLLAHAWVSYGGRVLNDTADIDQRFLPFTQSPLSQETLHFE